MPSVKQGGGYTLTFSKKNKDIEKLLADKKKQGIVITDYICNVVREFENNNNCGFNIKTLNLDIERMVQEQVSLALEKNKSISDVKISLEDNLEDVDIEED